MNVAVRAGPNPQYTPAQVITALEESGGVRALAGQKLGCSRQCVSNYIETYPEIADALEEIERTNDDLAKAQLLQAVGKGESWAVMAYLRLYTHCPGLVSRFGNRGGDDDAPGSASPPALPGGSNLAILPIDRLRALEAEFKVDGANAP